MRWISIIILFISLSTAAQGQNIKAQEEKRARLEREIEILDRQLSENASKSSSMLSNLTLIRKKVSNRKALVAESDREIRVLSDKIYLKQRSINRMQARIDTLSNHYSKLVLSAYKNRDARLWYMYMLASDNLGQAFRRMSYFKNLSSQMNQEARRIKEAKLELEKEREDLKVLKKEAESVKAVRSAELVKLQGEEKQSDKIVKQLQKNRRMYQNQLAAKKRQVDALNREIERMVSSAMNGGTSKGSSGKTDFDRKLAAEFSKNKGNLPWPADGPIVDRFGQKFHPVYKNLKLPPNNGVDIALAKGAKVRAVFDGVVRQIVVMPGYNKCILVQHGNYFTFYCKLGSTSVKAGDKVKTGDLLGTVDVINDQIQLHFQVWQGNKPQDPEHWLR
ncbi:MAG: peptidoglycan DD-metalloendopeptidase family protein [Bacteroidales bacterium]|nr:peptidoglycan DD-metalloendopeptidase family protein [Bacteroidales bacterium]